MAIAEPVVDTGALPTRLLTLADWDALPEDELHRLECSEGVLIVVPKPLQWHQSLSAALMVQLRGQLRPDLEPVVDTEVLLYDDPPTVRAPDVIVEPAEVYRRNPGRVTASEVLLAVEVLSVGTRRQDRSTKRAEYAEAAIPEYWIVDIAEATVRLSTYSLAPGPEPTYRHTGDHAGLVQLDTCGRRITLDLDALI